MKTLLFTLEYPPFRGGVANYYGNLVKYWPEPSRIFVLKDNLINQRLPFLKWLPAYFALVKKIRQEKIEHVIVGQILPLGTIAWLCSNFCKIKYSVILHGMDFTFALKSARKKWLAGKILNHSEKIICSNSYVAGLAKQTFPDIALKVKVVNPGVEPFLSSRTERSGARDLLNLPTTADKGFLPSVEMTNKIILLSVGRLVRRKGFDKVIEALPEVLKRVPNLVYVIIGDGPELKSYELRVTSYGLKEHVKIIEHAGDTDRDSWYNISDIFIMPSRSFNGDFEGFGIVYLEANLAGKPVIAGRSGGTADAVVDSVTGLMVNPEKVNEITEAIVKLALDPELRQKLGEQGGIRAMNDFNWANQIKKIYHSLVESYKVKS